RLPSPIQPTPMKPMTICFDGASAAKTPGAKSAGTAAPAVHCRAWRRVILRSDFMESCSFSGVQGCPCGEKAPVQPRAGLVFARVEAGDFAAYCMRLPPAAYGPHMPLPRKLLLEWGCRRHQPVSPQGGGTPSCRQMARAV